PDSSKVWTSRRIASWRSLGALGSSSSIRSYIGTERATLAVAFAPAGGESRMDKGFMGHGTAASREQARAPRPGPLRAPGAVGARAGRCSRVVVVRAPALARVRPLAGRRRARALGVDVGQLIVDPVARVARADDLLQALRAPRPLLPRHRQRAVDRVGLLLDVERVDAQREVEQLLMCAGVLRQERHAHLPAHERA